jgi:hypothetical protein
LSVLGWYGVGLSGSWVVGGTSRLGGGGAPNWVARLGGVERGGGVGGRGLLGRNRGGNCGLRRGHGFVGRVFRRRGLLRARGGGL